MKIKTSELSGAALDWAVAKCEGVLEDESAYYINEYTGALMLERGDYSVAYCPSKLWDHGGPIIEREKLDAFWNPDSEWWSVAGYDERADREAVMRDKSYLVAAMRCYVASKLGEYVDIPEELV